MYCSSCGTAVAHTLIYCNHCGAKLSGAKGDGKALEISPQSLVWATVATFVFGLAAIITFVSTMKKLDFNEGIVNSFLVFSFLLLLALEGVFIWLLLSRRRGEKEVSGTKQLNEQATNELYTAPARVLTEPVPSVTDHTTRTLEPIYSKRKE